MTRQIFVDIDTQHDFINHDGALPVPGAEQIRGNLRALTDYALDNGIQIIASADAHLPDDKEFEIFPPHCIQHTPGQQKIDETTVENTIVIKNHESTIPAHELRHTAAQILLEKQAFDIFTNPAADTIINNAAADEYIVYGVATDYCVKAAALGLLERGYKVAVVEDAIAAVASRAGREALALIKEQGATLKKTQEILCV